MTTVQTAHTVSEIASPELNSPELDSQGAPQIPIWGEIGRKVVHLSSVILPASFDFYGFQVGMTVLTFWSILFVGGEILRYKFSGLNSTVLRFFGPMMRANERGGDKDAGLKFTGGTWMLVSYCGILAVFPLWAAIPAFYITTYCDPAACAVGRTMGRTPLPGVQSRTVEGTLAFILVGLLLAYFQPAGVAFAVVAAGVIAAGLAEAYAGKLDDNLVIPCSAAFVIWAVATLFSSVPVA